MLGTARVVKKLETVGLVQWPSVDASSPAIKGSRLLLSLPRPLRQSGHTPARPLTPNNQALSLRLALQGSWGAALACIRAKLIRGAGARSWPGLTLEFRSPDDLSGGRRGGTVYGVQLFLLSTQPDLFMPGLSWLLPSLV